MAGHRRKKGAPLRSVARSERRLAWVEQSMKSAASPAEEVTAAANALRAALKDADPIDAAVVAVKATRLLTALARQLIARQARRKKAS